MYLMCCEGLMSGGGGDESNSHTYSPHLLYQNITRLLLSQAQCVVYFVSNILDILNVSGIVSWEVVVLFLSNCFRESKHEVHENFGW